MRNTGRRHAEKKGFLVHGGRGVIPLPPSFFFFVEGITPPPPQVPAGPCHHDSGKPPGSTSHAGDSTRNTGWGHAEKEPVRGHGGRGVIPLPPLSLFFRRGSPPTLVSGQVGVPTPRYYRDSPHTNQGDPNWVGEDRNNVSDIGRKSGKYCGQSENESGQSNSVVEYTPRL